MDPVLNNKNGDGDYHRLNTLIADVPMNFEPEVNLTFQKQYVRLIHYKRNPSIDDTQFTSTGNQQTGTIGEFVLLGEGVPKRVFYVSKILDLGRELNFGRIFWAATPMRMVDLGTNSLEILGAAGQAGSVIEDLRFSTPVLTPNGDRINDRITVSYIFRLPTAIPVELSVYGLDDALLACFDMGLQGAGGQAISWDGRDEKGNLLPPGNYLVDISIKAESKTFRSVRPVGVAY